MTRTLLRGGSLFDGSAFGDGDVVVEDGRIAAVGQDLDGDTEIDCSAATLLPGLIDCHVHVMVSGIDLLQALQKPFSYLFYEAIGNLSATLDVGITTVRDAGGADLGLKRAVENGLVRGPRMQISIAILSQTGGHADGWMPCGTDIPLIEPHPGMPSGVVDGVDPMRHKAREVLRAGADVLKVCTTGGVLSPADDPRHSQFSPAELAVLVEEAAAQHKPVMAHAQGADGIKNAVRAGVRSIEHGIYLDDEAIDLMLEHGTWLVPTLVAPQSVIAAADAGAAIPEVMVEKARATAAIHVRSITRAIEAGVPIAMGTDAGVGPHGTNLDELPLMVGCGMTAEGALRATTWEAARLLGLQDEIGRLEPGFRADLVLMDGDAHDLDGLAGRVKGVWQDGVRVVG
jgi:imidazolonepropionase-like amidohydrolase